MKLDVYAEQCGLSVKRVRFIAKANGIKIKRRVVTPSQIERLDTAVSDYHERKDKRKASKQISTNSRADRNGYFIRQDQQGNWRLTKPIE